METESIQSSRVYRINLVANLAHQLMICWPKRRGKKRHVNHQQSQNGHIIIYTVIDSDCSDDHSFDPLNSAFSRNHYIQTFELTERFRWYHLNGMNILSSFANRRTLFPKLFEVCFPAIPGNLLKEYVFFPSVSLGSKQPWGFQNASFFKGLNYTNHTVMPEARVQGWCFPFGDGKLNHLPTKIADGKMPARLFVVSYHLGHGSEWVSQ